MFNTNIVDDFLRDVPQGNTYDFNHILNPLEGVHETPEQLNKANSSYVQVPREHLVLLRQRLNSVIADIDLLLGPSLALSTPPMMSPQEVLCRLLARFCSKHNREFDKFWVRAQFDERVDFETLYPQLRSWLVPMVPVFNETRRTTDPSLPVGVLDLYLDTGEAHQYVWESLCAKGSRSVPDRTTLMTRLQWKEQLNIRAASVRKSFNTTQTLAGDSDHEGFSEDSDSESDTENASPRKQ